MNKKFLRNYLPPDFAIQDVYLEFNIDDHETEVLSILSIDNLNHKNTIVLDGENLFLKTVYLNDKQLSAENYNQSINSLTINNIPDGKFSLKILVKIEPDKNTALEGLYKNNDFYCTQCEAEGFRKITYYLDRPDVMSFFTVKIISDKKNKILLSNGNLIEQGDLQNNKHYVLWQDPFKKPCYLFALVAGNLEYIEDKFITKSAKEVTLKIFTEQHNIHKVAFAMQSLKKAMLWDEQKYNLEYDLNLFMIVAVDFFNMGAMENKGLNIFNTSCILADPKTETDAAFERVEAVIAHEYFHNFSGNRVTCRDWFQLSLKEGFTVFRDASFTADMHSPIVKRIEDVNFLRSKQFAEDASSSSHPVQPSEYLEISNFYTVTIYEKGAEIVRMLKTLVGENSFYKACALYFTKNDGQAVTIHEFIQAFEITCNIDLTQFKNWYYQAGTPRVEVEEFYEEQSRTYKLKFTQNTRDGQNNFVIPIALGLLDQNGNALELSIDGTQYKEYLFTLTETTQTLTFDNVNAPVIPSLLRGFSSPIYLDFNYTINDLLVLVEHDEDLFNRYDALQKIYTILLKNKLAKNDIFDEISKLINVYKSLIDSITDYSLLSYMLKVPTFSEITADLNVVDIDEVLQFIELMEANIAKHLLKDFEKLYKNINDNLASQTYKFEKIQVGQRMLKNTLLHYITIARHNDVLCKEQFKSTNMTEKLSALKILANNYTDCEELQIFYHEFIDDNLVINNWFSVQSGADNCDISKLQSLILHKNFNIKNPNIVRSVITPFINNAKTFHNSNGEGYNFLANFVLQIDEFNPQIAARLLTPFTLIKKYLPATQLLMLNALKIFHDKKLSADVTEILNNIFIDAKT